MKKHPVLCGPKTKYYEWREEDENVALQKKSAELMWGITNVLQRNSSFSDCSVLPKYKQDPTQVGHRPYETANRRPVP